MARRRSPTLAAPRPPPLLLAASSLILSFFLTATKLAEASFSVMVPYGESQCLAVKVPRKSPMRIQGNYDILDKGHPHQQISAILYNAQMKPVWASTPGEPEGIFSIVGRGRYNFCIENAVHEHQRGPNDGFDRHVGFAIRLSKKLSETDEKELSDADRKAHELHEMAAEMEGSLYNMMDHQDYLRNREEVHRELTEQTFSRVWRWTLIEALVLVSISCAQVLHLRKFFETRRYL